MNERTIPPSPKVRTTGDLIAAWEELGRLMLDVVASIRDTEVTVRRAVVFVLVATLVNVLAAGVTLYAAVQVSLH